MRPYWATAWAGALALLAPAPAAAAWNNVFQVCCNNCRKSVSASPVQPADPCPQPCTTRYVQRSYYQPVVTYKTSYYMEPVTSYRTSYYYEPVTSYRYSCYYDPCTCSYQQVSQPVTSYRLRSQSCPVTSYMQRCAVTPVTNYQQMFYYVPQTTCCQTTEGAPIFGQVPQQQQQQQQQFPQQQQQQPQVDDGGNGGRIQPYAQPQVDDGRQLQPGVQDGGNMKFPRQPQPQMPRVQDGNPARQPRLGAPEPWPAQPPPDARKDKIVALPDHGVEGRVVAAERDNPAGARVVFVGVGQERAQQEVSADGAGRFRAQLAAGKYRVYTVNARGDYEFQQTVEVGGDRAAPITLVKR